MGAFRAAAFLVLIGSAGQSGPDPGALLKEADRLAWFRAWSAAEPHFLQAQKLFAARGDERNALYAEVSAFRGALPRMAVPEASARLADYLEHPLVQGDERLRLRVLIIKGETDQDLDPTLAEQSWREAQTLAESLGDAACRGTRQLIVTTHAPRFAQLLARKLRPVSEGQTTRLLQLNGWERTGPSVVAHELTRDVDPFRFVV